MKRLIFILLFFPSITFGQQILWSTKISDAGKDNDSKQIPLENVINEVLEFYDFYDYYFDGSGFSKDGFIKTIESTQTSKTTDFPKWEEFKKEVHLIKEPTVFAFKSNNGKGSFVTVIYIDDKNVDMVIFSNNLEMNMKTKRNTDSSKKWFDTVFNSKSLLAADYVEGVSGLNYVSLSLVNRRFVVAPSIEDNGQQSGKIVVEIRVDREGKIISARAGVRGTTISNSELYEKCERAALGAQVNRLDKAPSVQSGVLIFNFKLK